MVYSLWAYLYVYISPFYLHRHISLRYVLRYIIDLYVYYVH